jgi:hypothetical protein
LRYGRVGHAGRRQRADDQAGTGRQPVEPVEDQVPEPADDTVPLDRAADRAAEHEADPRRQRPGTQHRRR